LSFDSFYYNRCCIVVFQKGKEFSDMKVLYLKMAVPTLMENSLFSSILVSSYHKYTCLFNAFSFYQKPF